MTVAHKMANRAQASTSRKVQPHNRQINSRAQKILALVPKVGAKSDLEDSDSSADELQHYPYHFQTHSGSSSPTPSLPSSLLNLNQLNSDEDEEIDNVLASTSLQSFLPSPALETASSPSILTPNQSGVLHHGNKCLNQLKSFTHPPSPLAVSSVQSPQAIASTSYEQVPSPLCVPSPSTATRSKKVTALAKDLPKNKPIKRKKLMLNWTSKKFSGAAEIEDVLFETSNEGFTPIDYFKQFFSDNIISLLTEQTNLYSTQVKGTSINLTEDDIKDFLAILIFMGVAKLPAYTDYWSTECRYNNVADIMTLKKFQMIRRYLLCNDNLKDDGDRYYKVRPLLQAIRANCLKIEEESRFSIDEMMVPHKGNRAGSRKQYIKNKPKKWGFKIFVRAGVSGIVYDFLLYGGDDTFRFHRLSDEENSMGLGSKVVLALAQSIHQPACKVLCFDNFFTSIELLQYLRNQYGIFALGKIRQNRLRGAEQKLPTNKNLKKKGRGSFAQVQCNKNKVVVVKWFDNKCVTAASTFVETRPVQVVMRYKKEQRRKMPVTCPNIVKEYNLNMGGVDLADMLVALYRTPFKGHRWYLPLIAQMIDISMNNAWLMYRRDFEKTRRRNIYGNNSNELQKMKPISLKKFRLDVYKSLLKLGRTSHVTNVPSTAVPVIKNPSAERPVDAVRFDQCGHLPTFSSKGRCKYCTKGQTKVFCQKCNLRLCFLPERNYFLAFHTK